MLCLLNAASCITAKSAGDRRRELRKQRFPRTNTPMIAIGEILFGRYRIDELLGESAGVHTYRGADLHALTAVHVKVWGDDVEPGAALLEGEAMAAVHHPGVVRLVDFGLHEGRRPCLMLEAVTGETLAERLRREGPMQWHEAFELGAQVLESLAAIHDEGLVHGDVSPHSLVLLPHGPRRIKLVGLQHVTLASLGEGRLADEPPVGVLEYKAPEQLAGAAVRASADLYALGLVLWEAMTGVSPFAAEPDSIPARLRWQPDLERVPGTTRLLPVAVKLALDRMLRPSLAYRDADARVCARRLRAALGSEGARTAVAWALAAG
jgi:serine/threonine protein kinase